MEKFWQTKSLQEMSRSEWESLCDGCARCCMIKLEDEDTAQVHYSALVCDLLDIEDCRCTDYPNRHTRVTDCVVLTPARSVEFSWLPKTCAYRTLAEGRQLETWHPLISGTNNSVHAANISVRDKVIHVGQVHQDEQQLMIVKWVEQ